jgi:lipopolysaccharide cholinephosphotransferase
MLEDFSKYNGEGTVLRKAQLRMLDILIVIDAICEKHAIPYWIDYGSLLGAVRHGGFIPWDDDLDISCLAKDYKRLRKALETDLPEHLRYQDWENEKNMLMKMGKVRDTKSYFHEELYKEGALKYQGIYVDIFPLIPIPSLWIRKKVDFLYGRALRRLKGFNASKKEYAISCIIWPFAKILAGISHFLCLFTGKNKIGNMYGSITIYCEHSIDDIFPLKKITFEGKEFNAPWNTDTYLRQIYNNYMQIPPVEKRQIHASRIEFYD